MFILGLLILLAGVGASTPPNPPEPAYILVHVADGVREVSGAHVFILAEDGRVLEEAVSNQEG